MSERRTVKTVLQYEVDQNSVRAATASAATVERAVKDIGGDFSRLGSVATSNVDKLRAQFTRARTSAEQLGDAIKDVNALQPGSPFASLGRIGREVRALPAVPITGSLSTDAVGKVVGVLGTSLDKFGVSVAGFATVAGAAAIAGGLLVVAIENISKASAEGKRTLNDALQAQDNYYKALRDFTTQQVQAQRDTLQAANEDLIRQRDENVNALQNALPQNGGFIQNLANTVGAITDNTPYDQLLKKVAELNAQISVNEQSITRYNQGLEQNAFLTNDLSAQFEADTNIIQKRSDLEAETLRFLATATRRSTDERIAAAQNEVNRLLDLNAELAARGGETAEKLIALNNARILENQFVVELTGLLRGFSDRRSDLQNAFNLVNGFVGDGIRGFNDGLETVQDHFEDLQPAFETIAKITKEQAESAAKLAEIEQRRLDAEQKALADANSAREDAQYELDRALEDQEREHKQALLEINRRANATIANAIGDRDALAAFLAQEQKREDIRTEKRNNKEALRRLERHFQDQQRTIDRRYAEQLAAAKTAAQRATEIERARLQVQVDALNQQLENQRTAAGLEVQIKQETNNAIIAGAIATRDYIVSLFGAATGTSTSSADAYAAYQAAQEAARAQLGTGRAYGGNVNTGQGVWVGEKGPEFVVFRQPGTVMTNRASMRAAGGMTFNIQVSGLGLTDAQVVRKVDERLNQSIKAARQKQARAL